MAEQGSKQSMATDNDPHWDITQQNIRDIGAIRTEVSSIAAQVDGVQHQMATGFADMRSALAQMSAPKPTGQWVPIAGLVISIMLAMGLVVSFTMTTLKQGTDQRFASVAHILDDFQQDFAWVDNRMSSDDDRELRDAGLMGENKAKYEALYKKVSHLDEIDHRDKLLFVQRLNKIDRELSRLGAVLDESNRTFYSHTAKEGSAGHPVPERKITAGSKTDVYQK